MATMVMTTVTVMTLTGYDNGDNNYSNHGYDNGDDGNHNRA